MSSTNLPRTQTTRRSGPFTFPPTEISAGDALVRCSGSDPLRVMQLVAVVATRRSEDQVCVIQPRSRAGRCKVGPVILDAIPLVGRNLDEAVERLVHADFRMDVAAEKLRNEIPPLVPGRGVCAHRHAPGIHPG